MFKLFKKKSEIDLLQDEYKKLLSRAHQLSTSNRRRSDEILAEAEEVLKKIDALASK